jgi:hypothetical protein
MTLSKKYIKAGVVYQDINSGWWRKCNQCGEAVKHVGKYAKGTAINCYKQDKPCFECSKKNRKGKIVSKSTRVKLSLKQIGRNNHFFGKKHTAESIKKMSETHIGHTPTNITRKKLSQISKRMWKNPEVRKKQVDAIQKSFKRIDVRRNIHNALLKTKFLGKRCDIGQPEMIKKWNSLGFNFEINYPITDDSGFLAYLDGYDKKHNIVLEYDSKYHLKPKQKEKDMIRQNKIVNILKPKKFWRYNSETKQIKNILGDYPLCQTQQ